MNLSIPPPPPRFYAHAPNWNEWAGRCAAAAREPGPVGDAARYHLLITLLATAELGSDRLIHALELARALPAPDEWAEWVIRVMEVGTRIKDPNLIRHLTDHCEPSVGAAAPPAARPPALSPTELEALLEPEERVLRYLAAPAPMHPYRRPVALVAGPGGLRVFKEVADESGGPMGITDREDEAYAALQGRVTGLPTYYGTRGGRVLVRDVAHGLMLTGLREHPLESRLAALQKVARAVSEIHAAGWWVADLHPDNITADGVPFDLSHARRCAAGETVPAFVTTPAYTAPEVLLRREAGHPADVYALGVLVCEIVACYHPTAITFGDPYFQPRSMEIVYWAVPALWKEPELDGLARYPALQEWVRGALNPDPAARPGVAELVTALARTVPVVAGLTEQMDPLERALDAALGPWPRSAPADAPRVLLPMRAAVPHRGHVNLIGRWIDLGFRPTVALAQSFTATRELNPVPKWVVARFLRAALERAGYDSKCVTILYIPYVEEAAHRALYAFAPGWAKTVAVCSGNPDVAELFEPILEGRPLVTSEAVCGPLGELNGTRLRRAIVGGDEETARRLAPPVVHDHLEEIRAAWLSPDDPEIPVVRDGKALVFFRYEGETLEGPLKPYEGPEEATLRRLQKRFPRAQFRVRSWADPKGPVVEGVNVCPFRLRFQGQSVDSGTRVLCIHLAPEYLTP